MTHGYRVRAAVAALLIGPGLFAAPVLAQVLPATPGVAAAPEPAPEPALPAEAARFRDLLQVETAALPPEVAQALRGFYAGRNFAPYWTAGAAEPAAQLLAALEASGDQGLPAGAYEAPALAAALAAGDPDARMRGEILAATAYLVYARDLAGGLVTPASVDPEINVTPARPAASALLARLGAMPADEVLAGLAPADPDYAALAGEKTRLEGLIRADAWGAGVPDGPTLHEGENGPRIAALRARLDRMGYPSAPGPEGEARFDATLLDAAKAFQRDHGLVDDGAVGARTLAAVNAGPEQRLAQVLVNLERLRWQGNDRAPRRIEVNIADFSAVLRDGDATPWRSRTVVGEARQTRTPEFSDTMTYFVVNPTWHIPDSIAKRVYLPKLQADPDVLANSNMRLFTRAGTEINPRLVDFTQYTSANFPFRVKQNPSSANALGRVKFMFPNQFAIYLHDTPAREYFARDARAFSNGCIRLEEPLELAYILLEGQVPDPAAAFAAWQAAGAERHVNLDRPIPVHIGYRTVFVDEGGAVRYRDDIYGRDAKVFRALEAAGVTIPAAQG